jgi:CRP-like cAMP-binding protein
MTRSMTEPEIVPLFAGLSRKQLALTEQLSTRLDIPGGRVLAHEGALGTEFLVVLDGEIDVIRRGELIVTRGPGSPLGEIALLGDRPRTATLVSRTPVRVRVSSRQEFAGMIAEIPAISERLRATMVERLAA